MLLNFNFLKAQQKFYPFTYENKDGLSDDKGNEVVAPIYNYWRKSENKKLLIFRPKYDEREVATLCFDVMTGQGKKFKTFYEDQVKIGNVQHHFVEELGSGKKYLQNSETDEILPFKEDVYYLKEINDDYFIAKYFPKKIETPKEKPKEISKTKVNGKIPPPPAPIAYKAPEMMSDNFIIYNSTNSLKAVLKVKANNYFLLNKAIPAKQDKNGNIIAQVIEINLNHFDFIVFENNGTYELYDNNFKLIKKFTSKPSSGNFINEEALAKCETFSGSVIERESGGYKSVGMASDRQREEPKFKIQKEDDVYYLMKKVNDMYVKTLSSPFKLEYVNEGKLWVEDKENKKTSGFYFDESTLQLFMPQKYLQNLNVKVLRD